jgi:hypothetical protein
MRNEQAKENILRARFAAIVFLAIASIAGRVDAAESVDLELVLAADGSGSIDTEEFRLQRAGYAAAVKHPRVLSAITAGLHGKIAIALVEWGAEESQHTIVDWTVIHDARSAHRFAEKLLAAPRVAFGFNSISGAIAYGAEKIRNNAYEGVRKIIDVSGDGPQIGGPPLQPIRRRTVGEGITINALVIKSPGGGYPGPSGEPLDEHYRNDVIGGNGPFVMIAEGRRHFAKAILQKLILEIAGKDTASPTVAFDAAPATR